MEYGFTLPLWSSRTAARFQYFSVKNRFSFVPFARTAELKAYIHSYILNIFFPKETTVLDVTHKTS